MKVAATRLCDKQAVLQALIATETDAISAYEGLMTAWLSWSDEQAVLNGHIYGITAQSDRPTRQRLPDVGRILVAAWRAYKKGFRKRRRRARR